MIKDFVKGGCAFTLKDLMDATLEAGGCTNEAIRELAIGVAMTCLKPSDEREQSVSTVLLNTMFKTLDAPAEVSTESRHEVQCFARDIYYLLQEYNWPMLRPDVETILQIYEHYMGVTLLGGDEYGETPRSEMLKAFTNFTLCREYEELFYTHERLCVAKSKLLEAYATDDKTQVLAAGAALICAVSEVCDSEDDDEADAAHDLLFTCLNLLEILNKWY